MSSTSTTADSASRLASDVIRGAVVLVPVLALSFAFSTVIIALLVSVLITTIT